MSQPCDQIIEQRNGPIVRLLLNNTARRNALTIEMWERLAAALDEIDADSQVRVCVIAGVDGQAFASGADLGEMKDRVLSPQGNPRLSAASAQLWRQLDAFSKPLIASVRGYCFGAGVGIATKADLRIVGRGAKICIPAGKVGLAYPLDLVRDLVAVIGGANAKSLLYTARVVDGAEALSIGFANELVDDDQVEDRVAQLAAVIAKNAPLALRAAKSAIAYASGCNPSRARADAELCSKSADYAEGLTAFAEKRSPIFQGR